MFSPLSRIANGFSLSNRPTCAKKALSSRSLIFRTMTYDGLAVLQLVDEALAHQGICRNCLSGWTVPRWGEAESPSF